MDKKYNIDYKMIGARIKEKRKEAHMTQEQLAERLDVTVGYVSQLERGITKISLDKLAEISSVLDCDISFFVTGASIGNRNYLKSEFPEKFSLLTTEQKQYILGFIDVMLKK